MVEYTVQDTDLVVGGKRISFGAPIAQHVAYDGFVVVRLTVTGHAHPDDLSNVIAVDADGSIRWKIPEQPPETPRPYTNVYTNDGDDLWANNARGFLFQVDPRTGELLDREFVK